METPKIRIVFLQDDESQPESSPDHLEGINAVLDHLLGSRENEPENELDTEPVKVSMTLPDLDNSDQTLTYCGCPAVAEYIEKLHAKLEQSQSLEFALARVLESGHNVHISNRG